MKNVILFSVILFTLGSCRKDPTIIPVIVEPLPEFKTMEFNGFKIEVPYAWTYTQLSGIDSYVGQINFSSSEHATFDLGWYSNQLNVDSASHDISYTTIDGKSAKIVQAIDPENGTTGVYFASIDGGAMKKFKLYTTHVTASHQQELLAAIETLDFVN